MLLFNAASGILRGVGDSRRPLLYLGVCCVLNILLDILFVAELDYGVAGAAWATVLSQTVGAVLILAQLFRSQEGRLVEVGQEGHRQDGRNRPRRMAPCRRKRRGGDTQGARRAR